MKYLKTCEMKDIYPETAKHLKVNEVYHHFINGDKTISYPIKGAEFKTPEMCLAYFNKMNKALA